MGNKHVHLFTDAFVSDNLSLGFAAQIALATNVPASLSAQTRDTSI
jgi:hypothetical protein